jgi:hypothetical protein
MAGSERPFGLRAALGSWRAPDRWVASYALLTLPVLALGAARGLPGCAAQAAVSLGALGALAALVRWSRDTFRILPTLLRLFSGPLLYWAFYHQVQTLWPVLRSAPLDGRLAWLEFRLWGLQPSLALPARFPYRWLSELFCFVYFAYYLYVPVVGLSALLTRGYAAAERMIQAVSGCFFTCYTFFWLFPTVGPHYWFPPGLGPTLHPGYVFNHVLDFFTSGGEIRGGAFPSSHIAVALLLTLLARRTVPRLFPALAVLTALLLPAVVYLRAHYLVDVPAGLAAGLLAYAAAEFQAGSRAKW